MVFTASARRIQALNAPAGAAQRAQTVLGRTAGRPLITPARQNGCFLRSAAPLRTERIRCSAAAAGVDTLSRVGQVLKALEAIIDPDFMMNIVECGFVKDLVVGDDGAVSFRLELTTPACPIKGEFERQANAVVKALDWVTQVRVPD